MRLTVLEVDDDVFVEAPPVVAAEGLEEDSLFSVLALQQYKAHSY